MLEGVIAGNIDMAKVSTGVVTSFMPEFGIFDLRMCSAASNI